MIRDPVLSTGFVFNLLGNFLKFNLGNQENVVEAFE